MATKEEKLKAMYKIENWKGWIGVIVICLIMLAFLCYDLEIKKNIVQLIRAIGLFVTLLLLWAAQNQKIIRILNNRIADLEEKLEKK